jgi:hypothetical protein
LTRSTTRAATIATAPSHDEYHTPEYHAVYVFSRSLSNHISLIHWHPSLACISIVHLLPSKTKVMLVI